VEPVISPAFARALEAGRPRYNTLFAQARRGNGRLDGAAFLLHLRRSVDPVVTAAEASSADSVPAVVDALYEVSLELLSKGVLGPDARSPDVDRLWPAMLCGCARFLAEDARTLVAALSNGLYNLVTTPDCRAQAWIDILKAVAPLCHDQRELLRAGQVAGWRCGLAHLRDGALAVATELPTDVVRAVFGLKANAVVADVLLRMIGDPWLDPDQPSAESGLRQVAVVGAFRGFGGVFVRPPKVAYHGGSFFAFDGVTCWHVAADVFGSTFHRAGTELPVNEIAGQLTIDNDGKVKAGRATRTFAHLRGSTSFASSPTTLAVTLPNSHSLYLIAGAPA
jgi:hypothetical protein